MTLFEKGIIKPTRIGKYIRFKKEDLDNPAYLTENSSTSNSNQ